MSTVPSTSARAASSLEKPAQLSVPASLQSQLAEFKRRVWATKMGEALVLAAAVLLLAYLTVYAADRLTDTAAGVRTAIFFGALAAWLVVPWALYRWVWQNRRLEQVARLLRVREPIIGDQLLGVIELAHNESEQTRSRTLCAAAIAQVADAAKSRDLRQAAPPTWLKSLATMLTLSAAVSVGLAVLFPAAAQNAWARLVAPWKDTPRYTFAAIEPVSPNRIVPHGESAPLTVSLKQESRWQPALARLQIGAGTSLSAELVDGSYHFELPPLTAIQNCRLQVGDYSQSFQVEPRLRPELATVAASVKLPDYLQRSAPFEQDVRSGVLSAVEGSQSSILSTASRELKSAHVNDVAAPVKQATFVVPDVKISGDPTKLRMTWEDFDGLAGREPFELAVRPTIDQLPTVVAQGLPRQAVVLESEQLNFEALAADDFGVKRIGITWKGLDERLLVSAAAGEKVIASGDSESTSLQVPAVFCAKDLGITAQPIAVQLWAEDYHPDHPRVLSPPQILFVLTADQHAVWITEQLSKWHRAALEVRDKEMQLHEANKRLREMTAEQLADAEMRQELRRQAALEAANARRLNSLTRVGTDLLRQASRNPEIGVGHLERWAEMLELLNEIGGRRMPSVADLIDKASSQQQLARASGNKPTAPSAGNVRDAGGGKPSNDQPKENQPPQPAIPRVVDVESSLQPNEPTEGDQPQPGKKKNNGSRQGLPVTTLAGPAGKPPADPPKDEPDNEAPFDQALVEQADLLAEFEKIADELNAVLANLEGSTLVKRLKAASREQNQVAEKIGSRIDAVFGQGDRMPDSDKRLLADLGEVETKSSQNVSFIMDDMQSYFERRRMNQFKLVLDDMKSSNVLTALQSLGEELPTEHGLSIAQAEFWADALDRWAEDLVDPACSGSCPGCKTSDSLPPSVILEVMRILEGEINLREATRVAEQARPSVEAQVHEQEAKQLSKTQTELAQRTDQVMVTIRELPQGSQRFGKELALLTSVSQVMGEAATILADNDTGSKAMAAETHAIELLLQCKRINPNGGGGGGDSPGGGGKGDTRDAALALLGAGLNQHERREARDVAQAVGETGRVLPEEFRGGLDVYFERLEQGK